MNSDEYIFLIRDKSVMLDFKLSELFSVKLIELREVTKKYFKLFPDGSVFRLTKEEYNPPNEIKKIESKIYGTSKSNSIKTPFAFTDKGAEALQTLLGTKNNFRFCFIT